MQINFQTEVQPTVKEKTESMRGMRAANAYGAGSIAEGAASGIVMDISGGNAAHGFKGVSGMGGSKNEKKGILDDVNSFDAKNAHNYMAVMSNTMSERDFQAMKEEGYHPGRMSEAEAVTGLDRIKVVLAEAGVNVAGFTDNIDRETAAEITGSEAAANAITGNTPVDSSILSDEKALSDFAAAGFRDADLPATDENIAEALKAFDTAAKLEPLDNGAVEYMLSNAMEPTIENAYMAEHSGAGNGSGQAAGYFDNNGTGYYAEIADADDLGELAGQIDGIIEEAGLTADEATRKDAEYLIKEGFALNSETLRLFEDLSSISFPLKAGDLMSGIADAVARGETAGNAYIIKGYERIKNERILNETRLQMNTEANRALRSDNGFALETEELSERVDELKKREQDFYRAAFMKDGAGSGMSIEDSISLAEETLFKVSGIKDMPAAVIGSFASAEAFTVNDVYEAGNLMKQRFDAASATYEAVGTEVRADLGDRIGDAFRNAADLLHELGIKDTIDNLRAVRILGYNSMEITGENIAGVKAADETVRTLINRLTGAATISLIREGINPLETSAQDLIDKISEMQGLDEENGKFSEYLFKLERNHEVSEDEATSYIGIYRLIRQIENSDGAVIGSLVNSGKELSLKNLLTELRTRGRGHMDFSIDEDFGGVKAAESASDNMRIDAQIETAFRNENDDRGAGQQHGGSSEERYARNVVHELYDSITPENTPSAAYVTGDTTLEDLLDHMRNGEGNADSASENLYDAEMLQEIREASLKEDNVYEMLLRYGQEITPENINAMDSLMNERGTLFSDMINLLSGNVRERIKESSDEILEKLGGDDEEAPAEDVSGDVKEAYGKMAEALKSEIELASETADSYIDLKALKSINRKLTIAKALSNEENYELPMELDGVLTSVNLKIIRGTGEAKAAVSLETERLGKVYGEFTLSDRGLSGYVTAAGGDDDGSIERLSEGFIRGLDNAGLEHGEIIFEKSLPTDINRIPEIADKENVGDSAVLYRTAKIFLQEVTHAHQQ